MREILIDVFFMQPFEMINTASLKQPLITEEERRQEEERKRKEEERKRKEEQEAQMTPDEKRMAIYRKCIDDLKASNVSGYHIIKDKNGETFYEGNLSNGVRLGKCELYTLDDGMIVTPMAGTKMITNSSGVIDGENVQIFRKRYIDNVKETVYIGELSNGKRYGQCTLSMFSNTNGDNLLLTGDMYAINGMVMGKNITIKNIRLGKVVYIGDIINNHCTGRCTLFVEYAKEDGDDLRIFESKPGTVMTLQYNKISGNDIIFKDESKPDFYHAIINVKDDILDGKCESYYKDGCVVSKSFSEGKEIGDVQVRYPNGCVALFEPNSNYLTVKELRTPDGSYVGNFSIGEKSEPPIPQGMCKMKSTDGSIYIGDFVNGQKNGNFVVINPQGESSNQTYEYDHKIEWKYGKHPTVRHDDTEEEVKIPRNNAKEIKVDDTEEEIKYPFNPTNRSNRSDRSDEFQEQPGIDNEDSFFRTKKIPAPTDQKASLLNFKQGQGLQ